MIKTYLFPKNIYIKRPPTVYDHRERSISPSATKIGRKKKFTCLDANSSMSPSATGIKTLVPCKRLEVRSAIFPRIVQGA